MGRENAATRGLFGEETRLGRLSSMGDPLERVGREIDWESFRPTLDAALGRGERPQGGRPPWDSVVMFKIMMLQQWDNLSDDAAEYLINDRLSFQRFLGLTLDDRVPDAKTIWLFRERLKDSGAAEGLFALFAAQLERAGIVRREGSIVDATFVDAPRQRNTRDENAQIKEGKVPESFGDNPHRARQKDTDARWAMKGGERHYGYKDHVKADRRSKLITGYAVTSASPHDSTELAGLMDDRDRELWADSAYAGAELLDAVREKSPGIGLHVCEKGVRGRPLTEGQKASNTEKSRTRVRVEHVFGHMTNSMGGITVRCIGLARARCAITLKNLAYNMQRAAYLATRPAAA